MQDTDLQQNKLDMNQFLTIQSVI